jgi:hypothetical protein
MGGPGTVAAQTSYTVQGRTVPMPAVVRDASSGTALFLVPADAVQRLLPGDDFVVSEAAPGVTQVVLGFVDYRDNDLGDYHEAMVAFFVRPRADPAAPEGTFLYRLPVDQSFTCEAGRRIWGFPKTVETIAIDYAADRATCRLEMDGVHVFTLSLPRTAAGEDGGEMDLVTYSYVDGPAATAFRQGGAIAMIDGAGVSLELGSHPLADELRGLGMPAAPLLGTWTESMRGSFAAPRRLG